MRTFWRYLKGRIFNHCRRQYVIDSKTNKKSIIGFSLFLFESEKQRLRFTLKNTQISLFFKIKLIKKDKMTSRLLFIQVIGLFIGFCLNNAAAVPVLEDEIRASGFEIAKNMVFTTQSSVITTENSILFNQDSNEQVSENMQIQQIQQISTVSTISQHSDDIDNDDNAEISTNEPNIDNQHSDDIDDDDNAEISTNEPNIANQHSDKQILTDVHQSSEQPLKNNHHNDIVDNSKTFTTEPNTATALDSIEYKEEENPAVSTTDLHLPIAELRLPILKQNTLQQLNSAHLMQPILTSETVNRFVRFQLPSRAVKCQCFLSSSENGTSYLVDLFQTRRYNVELFIEQGVTRHCKAHCDVEVRLK